GVRRSHRRADGDGDPELAPRRPPGRPGGAEAVRHRDLRRLRRVSAGRRVGALAGGARRRVRGRRAARDRRAGPEGPHPRSGPARPPGARRGAVLLPPEPRDRAGGHRGRAPLEDVADHALSPGRRLRVRGRAALHADGGRAPRGLRLAPGKFRACSPPLSVSLSARLSSWPPRSRGRPTSSAWSTAAIPLRTTTT